MSERYGTCKACSGRGDIRIQTVRDGVTTTTHEECGMCNGEGFSGDAFEDPKYLREQED